MNLVTFICLIFLVGIIAVRIFLQCQIVQKLKQTGGKHAILFFLHRHFFLLYIYVNKRPLCLRSERQLIAALLCYEIGMFICFIIFLPNVQC